jgi:hypothetical protein
MHTKSPLRLVLALILAGAFVLVAAGLNARLSGPASADEPSGGAGKFTLAIWGDLPYTSAGTGTNTPKVPNLIADMNRDTGLAFTAFLGDTKDGSSMCTDTIIGSDVRTRFNSVAAPTIYTIGDNEWTDCHRINNGGYDGLERLSFIRKTLFNTAESFGQRNLMLEHQGALGGPYAENTRWIYNNVVFAAIHVVGSNNNKVTDADCLNTASKRTQAQCDADNVEYQERDAMNLLWLRRTFDQAKQLGAPGLMIFIQADPWFDLPETTTNEREAPGVDGFNNFLQTLTQETQAYKGQVVLVHGDTHFFKVDMPLITPAKLLPNFTRVEGFGSGNADWVKVNIDPAARNPFTFEPMIVP